MNYRRLALLLLIDTTLVITACITRIFLVQSSVTPFINEMIITSLIVLICHHIFSYIFRLYQKAWSYASIKELVTIVKTVVSTSIASSIMLAFVFHISEFPVLIINGLLYLILLGGSRFCWRVYRDSFLISNQNKKRTLIIGAGSAGTMVARQLKNSNVADLHPVAFIDDQNRKQKLEILGIPIVGKINDLQRTVQELQIEHIIIAIPSLKKDRLNEIFQECAKTQRKTQILPMLEDLLTGKLTVNKFRDVQVEDILGREPVKLNVESISEYITNQVVLVTGAGGSIGSELCRQVAQFHPKKLILLGHGENSIFNIENELKEAYKDRPIEIFTEIADIQDEKKMFSIMEYYHPNVVYHAAAHKHVTLMERNPEEAVKNNLIGTGNVAKAASWYNVQTFVMISSDKAVNPTSVMGATKKLSEMLIQQLNNESNTKFVVVRFGNVLGSRGSVIPLFSKQIASGGPVTVTDPNMQRYFMTIPEASRLVIQSGALAKGGEIFVLDMGEPVKIVDLAKNLIQLSGHSLDEIKIEFTGIRQGEKLFEELLNDNEIYNEQVYPKIFVGKTRELCIGEIEEIIANYIYFEKDQLRQKLIDTANLQEISHKVLPISG